MSTFGLLASTVLIMDNFSAHMTTNVNNNLKKAGCHPSLLPPNTTPILQPLDVLINRAFKNRVLLLYEQWQLTMYSRYPEIRQSIKTPIPDRQTVAQFIIWAWNSIPKKMIIGAFKRAGLLHVPHEEEEEEEEDKFDAEKYADQMPDPKNINQLLAISSTQEDIIDEEEEEEEE